MNLSPKPTVAGSLAAVAVALAAPTAQASFPGTNGRIAFGVYEVRDDFTPSRTARSIDTALPSGRGRRSLRACVQVTGAPERGDCSIQYTSPAWSPRGSRLAFDAGTRIALIRSDGTGFRLLAPQTADDGEPAWSPRGTHLVFSGAPVTGGQRDLYILDLRNGRLRRLTFRGGRSPAWSSRGRIAFVRGNRPSMPGFRGGEGDVFTVRSSGRGLRRITRHRGGDPDWSPHATKLAFVRQRRFGPFKLYVVKANGRGLRRLSTPGADSPEQPAWAPNGKWIAYHSFDSGVWAQRLNGTGARQVAPGGVGDDYGFDALAPDWQPLPRR
jgi:Tol biopolymer transport system component